MSNTESPTELSGPSPRAFLRNALYFGAGVASCALVVWLATRPPQKTSEEYYPYHHSISRAEKLAMVCHLKGTNLSNLNRTGSGKSDFEDIWGQPFRFARVPADGGDDIYVWTDWTEEDGRVFVVGVKVTADGTTVRLGLPPELARIATLPPRKR